MVKLKSTERGEKHMNLSNDNKIYINTVLNDKALGCLYPVLDTGITACREFIKLNKDYFDCKEFLNTVPGTLLTYSISKQVKKQCALSSSQFILMPEKINQRNGYSVPILKKENVNLSIIRTTQRFKLDNPDKKYLKNKCRKNDELDNQIALYGLSNDVFLLSESFHGVVLYGIEKDFSKIKFADIVFFDSNLKNVEYYLDISEKLHIYENSINKEQKEENILTANNLIKEFMSLENTK